MNIPHINMRGWKINTSDEQSIEKAWKDKKKRKFSIRFNLEDLRARTQYVHISLSEELSQSGPGNEEINIWFEKNKKGFLRSILVELETTDHQKAFRIAHDRVASILSMLTFFYRRPCRVSFYMIFDKTYNLSYSTFTFCSKAETLILPTASLSKEVPIGSLLASYREGMNSLDLAYRYISFFKIYEAWYKEDFAFKLTNNVLKQESRPEFKITKDFLSGIYIASCHKEFLDKSFKTKEVFSHLNYCRNLLAHYMLDRYKELDPHFINFDDIKVIRYFEAITTKIGLII
jgi:hypothetical protein